LKGCQEFDFLVELKKIITKLTIYGKIQEFFRFKIMLFFDTTKDETMKFLFNHTFLDHNIGNTYEGSYRIKDFSDMESTTTNG